MGREELQTFVASLQPHDSSVAIALLELLRGADASGRLERGDWLTAVCATHPGWKRAKTESEDADQDLARYFEEHVLALLVNRGVAHAEPEGPGWERVRVDPVLWDAISEYRRDVLADLELTVRNLLQVVERRPESQLAPASAAAGLNGSSKLTAQGLVKIYRKRKVVNDVDLSVSQGEIVGLLGPNGAGKTTSFYVIVGLIQPDRGQVFLDDRELTTMPMYRRARQGIGYLPQEHSVFRKLTVEENILAILETLPLSRAERKERLEVLLDELAIKHLRKARAYSLSGGERRRLEITRALVSEPKFMLLDEPFAGVDPIAVHDIQQIVAGLRHRGIGVIITDHNVEQTLDIVDRAYIMYDGRVRVSGTVAELVWNDEVAEIYLGPTLTARMRGRYSRPGVG
jgi:lipopolysaccharide export system ATP-binding protein